mgnify:CR=1 FL=1
MRSPERVLNSLSEHSKVSDYKFERLYRVLFNPDMFLLAYHNIQGRQGNIDVITCAAPNLREKPSNAFNTGDGKDAIKITDKELLAIHEKRLRRILDVALNHGVETIVLGAFGCGAFMNNPNVVALGPAT